MTLPVEAAFTGARTDLFLWGIDVDYWDTFTWESLPPESQADFLHKYEVILSDPRISVERYRQGRRWVSTLRETL